MSELFQNQTWKKTKKIKTKKAVIEVKDGEEIVESNDVEEVWRDQLKSALRAISPPKFEMFARGLINEMGIGLDKILGKQNSADGGLDGFGYITADDFRTMRLVLKAKCWERKFSYSEIDKFRGTMDKYNAEYGVFITTSDYKRSTIEASRIMTCVINLINGADICDLVVRYEFYVTSILIYELKDFY